MKNKLLLWFILGWAALDFILLLKHKSPYLSDSYFYQHIYYELQGDTFTEAREKVLSNIDFSETDARENKFYLNEQSYRNTLGFFTKRPLYPFVTYLINIFIKNEFFSFLIPVFLAYILTLYFVYKLFGLGLRPIMQFLAALTFKSFYPFLDWSTYFLTDTIGSAFWLGLIYLIYKIISTAENKFINLFYILLVVSLFNREQTLLFTFIVAGLLVNSIRTRVNLNRKKIITRIFRLTLVITAIYFFINLVFKQKNLLDTIIYTQNDYGLLETNHTASEILKYMISSIFRAHKGLVEDLIRHRNWFVVTALGSYGMIKYGLNNKLKFKERIMLYSGLASYLGIFFYPVLSYRYFFPLIASLIYFTAKIFQDYFGIKRIQNNTNL